MLRVVISLKIGCLHVFILWGSVKQFEGCSGFYYSATDFGMWVMHLVLLPLIITKF
jgi:TRAP-type C4-dicarboxylate transport system permease small subunit